MKGGKLEVAKQSKEDHESRERTGRAWPVVSTLHFKVMERQIVFQNWCDNCCIPMSGEV